MLKKILLALCLSAGCGPAAWAMSYVPMSDRNLLGQADLVIRGTITEAIAPPGKTLEQSRYRVVIAKVIKGQAGAAVEFSVPGALDSTQAGALIVPGAPRFAEGEEVLLFLSREADGGYVSTQLPMGSFHYRQGSNGRAVVERAIADVEDMIEELGVPHRRYRDAGYFEQWLRDCVQGIENAPQYWSDAADAYGHKYNLTTPLGRWFEFDQGLDVPVYAGTAGLLGLSSGGYPELQQAIAAWNGANSQVSLVYKGTTSLLGGLGLADGVSEVLFNDPNNEITGVFNCVLGGIGAYTKWRGAGTRIYKGQQFYQINESDVVVQDGASCLLARPGKNNTAEILAHELGHFIGLAHSCGDEDMEPCESGSVEDEALMRPSMHADGRGAKLNSDDRAGLNYLYDKSAVVQQPQSADGDTGESGGGGGGLPLASVLVLLAGVFVRRRRSMQ